MSNALDAFRAQREAVEQVHARLTEVSELVRGLRSQIDAMAKEPGFQNVLRDEERWLDRAERMIVEVRRLRDQELARFWPAVWRRWIAAIVFSLATSAALGVGYVSASRPYEAELAALRQRVELLDFMAQRVLTMTPAERRQFDALMKWAGRSER